MSKGHTKWAALRQEAMQDPEFREAYEAAGRAIALGEQIRCLREAHGLTQAELARRIGTTQPAIARLEAGGVEPKIETLVRLSRALDAELIVDLSPRTGMPVDGVPTG